jgi:hypothetical protein
MSTLYFIFDLPIGIQKRIVKYALEDDEAVELNIPRGRSIVPWNSHRSLIAIASTCRAYHSLMPFYYSSNSFYIPSPQTLELFVRDIGCQSSHLKRLEIDVFNNWDTAYTYSSRAISQLTSLDSIKVNFVQSCYLHPRGVNIANFLYAFATITSIRFIDQSHDLPQSFQTLLSGGRRPTCLLGFSEKDINAYVLDTRSNASTTAADFYGLAQDETMEQTSVARNAKRPPACSNLTWLLRILIQALNACITRKSIGLCWDGCGEDYFKMYRELATKVNTRRKKDWEHYIDLHV